MPRTRPDSVSVMMSSPFVVSSSRLDDDHARGAPRPPSARSSSSSPTATSSPRRRRLPRDAVLVADVDIRVVRALTDIDRLAVVRLAVHTLADSADKLFRSRLDDLFNAGRKHRLHACCHNVTVVADQCTRPKTQHKIIMPRSSKNYEST